MVYDNGELTFTEDDVEFHMKKVDSFTQYSQDELTGMYNNTIFFILFSFTAFCRVTLFCP